MPSRNASAPVQARLIPRRGGARPPQRRLGALLGLLLTILPGLAAAAPPPVPGLTAEERTFLSGRRIRVAVDSARPPFEYLDEKGAYSGICATFIQECCLRLGLELQVVPGLTVAQGIAKVEAGEVDLIPKVTPSADRAQHLDFTQAYVTFPSVIISRKDARFVGGLEDLQGLKVSVLKGLIVEELLRKDRPQLPLIPYGNIKDALLALSTGQTDIFVDNLGTVSYNIDKLGLTNLKIAAPTPYNHDLAFGVRKDMPLLRSALDKALASLSDRERAAIKDRWLALSDQRGTDWRGLAPYGGAVALILVFTVAWNLRLGHVIRDRDRVQRELLAHGRLLEAQACLKTRVAAIASELHKARTFEALGEAFLHHVAPLAGLAQAAVYILDGRRLRCVGGYGRGAEEGEIAVGQGLVGQCALDGKPIELTGDEVPFRIPLGCGELAPRALLVLPVLRMEEVRGVAAMASATPFTAEQRALLEEILPELALNFEILAGQVAPCASNHTPDEGDA